MTRVDPLVAAVLSDLVQGLRAPIVGIIAREEGRRVADDDDRIEIFELFRVFRLGAGL